MGVNTQKRLLVAGGGYADIPMIAAARDLGYYVITSGNRPDELGHRYSDECRPADFSDRDAMLAVAQELEVDAICPSCNDFSAISCAYVAEQLGLPGHDPLETSLLLHHKDRYRTFARANAIPTPHAKGFSSRAEALNAQYDFTYPVIIKPVDLTGGKGIAKVSDPGDFARSVDDAFAISRSSRIVIEEFLEGSRHGFSAFLRDGKIVFHFVDDEYYYLNPYLVSAASAPPSLPREVTADLIGQSEKIARLMKLKTGIFHVQFILHRGNPVIVEICRRPPGDLYVNLVKYATGVDYPKWIVRGFAGDTCNGLSHEETMGNYLRHCIMADREGTIRDVEFDPSIENNIVERFMFWQPGDEVDNAMVAKFGIVFMKFDSRDEMTRAASRMQKLIRARVQ